MIFELYCSVSVGMAYYLFSSYMPPYLCALRIWALSLSPSERLAGGICFPFSCMSPESSIEHLLLKFESFLRSYSCLVICGCWLVEEIDPTSCPSNIFFRWLLFINLGLFALTRSIECESEKTVLRRSLLNAPCVWLFLALFCFGLCWLLLLSFKARIIGSSGTPRLGSVR